MWTVCKGHDALNELNFRNIQIEPCNDDMNQRKSKFKYFNQTVGQYANVDSYLETHFHLMREDFFRPLREGLRQYLNRNEEKNSDISVYENVRIIGVSIIQEKFIYRVKLNLGKKHALALAESSKNMMQGNLVLISCDHLTSCHWAVIEMRDENLRINGIVGISFLSQIKVDISKSYTLIEPTNFYVPYKHVLTALQFLNENNFPLAEHIVRVEKEVCPPAYLSSPNTGIKSEYDLSVVVYPSLMHQSFSRDSIFEEPNLDECRRAVVCTVVVDPVVSNALKNVRVTDNIKSWPTADKFKLDKSQFAALHHALSSRMTLIQGPPGTGKTFIGLKIVQALLHNSVVWRSISTRKISKIPILIVCYTNHALDQFLEEMKSNTRNIVRIGGSCESVPLKTNQIQELKQVVLKKKQFPRETVIAGYSLNKKVRKAETRFNNLQSLFENLTERRGIITLNLFSRYKIIPEALHTKFSPYDYLGWILPNTGEVHYSPINDCVEDELARGFDDLRVSSKRQFQRIDSPTMSDIEATTIDFDILPGTFLSKIARLENESWSANSRKKINEMRKELNALEKLPVYVTNDILYLEVQTGVDIYHMTFQDRLLLYASWKRRLEEHYRYRIKNLQQTSIERYSTKPSIELVQSQILSYKAQLQGLLTVKGLIKWESFTKIKIIPKIFRKMTPFKYHNWLLTSNEGDPKLIPTSEMWSIWKPEPNSRLSDDVSVWQDNVEAYREMLAVRRDNFIVHRPIKLSDDFFEVTSQNYTKKIIALQQQKKCMYDDTLDFEINELQVKRKTLNRVLMVIKGFSDAPETETEFRFHNLHMHNLTLIDRCRLYASWRRSLIEILHQEMSHLRDELQELAAERLAIRTSQYLHICRQADIVGMTTTGAAKWQSLLNDLKPKIGECVNV